MLPESFSRQEKVSFYMAFSWFDKGYTRLRVGFYEGLSAPDDMFFGLCLVWQGCYHDGRVEVPSDSNIAYFDRRGSPFAGGWCVLSDVSRRALLAASCLTSCMRFSKFLKPQPCDNDGSSDSCTSN